ncbi:MAG: DUF1049 domain-containing protein [Aestuariibacter sp.]|uniref:lipopolysaccharide assembly protein LapA domain-containing protein n=1 Tax=Marisediminitalea aggregata TaxID=634436 RepID=UPI0012B7AB6F|nr:lipopolysaccharide assembly protein LapA domain-containing protein [Marisediminitalea aggregata]MCP3865242.1 DUF1049 domain-containing protein [Aestuariibacter sp.]MCP4525201.1 DUF1049 domain-containing protein [Aestuariibacter sp.]MCP4947935.1 DUF1049 domain-containing protein [Aestuariibacter sp.]
MKQIKTFAIIALLMLCAVFILQNSSMVEVTLLFWQFSLPRALLIILVLLIGILIGALVSRNKRYLFR